MIALAEQPTTTAPVAAHRDTQVRTEDVVAFIRRHGRQRVFRNWSDEQVAQWLSFYSKHGDCIVIVDRAKAVTAVMVGWKTNNLVTMETPWEPSDPKGTCYYIAQIIAPGPAAIAALFHDWLRRHEGTVCHIYARRKGKEAYVTRDQIRRLIHSPRAEQKFHQAPCVTRPLGHDGAGPELNP